jgi:uncharacterized protein (DUF302 family)
MNILVTGSSGWLGQTLVPRLVRDGHKVVGLDPEPGPTTEVVGSVVDRALVRHLVRDHGIEAIVHGAAADKVGLELPPTVVVVFGNPRAGTPSMRKTPTLAIDLPLRMLIWQDDKGATSLAYNDPDWLFRRHGITDDGSVDVMIDVLASIAGEATG